MKRSSTPRARPKAAKSRISSSLTPRTTTQLTLTGSQAGGQGGVDAGQDLVQRVAPGDGGEAVGSQRVAGDVDAAQPGRGQVGGLVGQGRPVGGHGQVDAEVGQLADQHRKVGPHRRLTPGEADALETEALARRPPPPG